MGSRTSPRLSRCQRYLRNATQSCSGTSSPAGALREYIARGPALQGASGIALDGERRTFEEPGLAQGQAGPHSRSAETARAPRSSRDGAGEEERMDRDGPHPLRARQAAGLPECPCASQASGPFHPSAEAVLHDVAHDGLEVGRGRAFDLGTIDEASQMRPEDALGALLRARQIVVVGDAKQLPPNELLRPGDGRDAIRRRQRGWRRSDRRVDPRSLHQVLRSGASSKMALSEPLREFDQLLQRALLLPLTNHVPDGSPWFVLGGFRARQRGLSGRRQRGRGSEGRGRSSRIDGAFSRCGRCRLRHYRNRRCQPEAARGHHEAVRTCFERQ